jgi:xanthine dehydrogenase YagT iron-sulfur-binding subunit
MTERRGVTRRGLLQGLGAAAAAGGVAGLPGVIAAGASQAFGQDGAEVLGPGPVAMRLHVNGTVREVRLEPRATLLDALRGPLGLVGPKEVCDLGACGACTVLVDERPVCACMVLALDVAQVAGGGPKVTTVEAFSGAGGAPGDLQRAFVEKDALQCGFCTCGMVTAAEGLLRATPQPTADDVRAGLSGNLCRCGTYPRIVEAVLATASLRRKGR